ncbi:Frequency clock protein [Fulvia fulva]|uniref:Frequency clock protein n=1 Tax=Passalora fulva TaxID=5499 RepID=A0A9Q8UTG2_PASFU|nr:Frequency clock protein [Fulvia fulva]UJO21836.1 Frequency clock protein [Fulvia fulva]
MADQLPQPMIVMTPPEQAHTSSSSHPRRPPAHRSVSLLHSPRTKPPTPVKDASDSSSDDPATGSRATAGSSDSPSSLAPLGRNSSGESSNADKWFEKSNNDVRDTSFADNEPPFFMRNSSSSQTPPEAQQQMRQYLGINDASTALPMRTGLAHLNTDGSSTEDFRGVIDDLTIENKKLKRKLKKYQKLHDSHLKDEKLFEVRIHGLPAEKKRELEDTLRKFAASLGTGAFPANGYAGLKPLLETQKTASSQTSLQNTDSAYASMSMSGQGSNAHSGNESRHQPVPTSTTRRSMRSNIQSYLHHIPERLLVQPNPANMTERAKKKLVARRLEQLFAGKGAVGGHQQPMQQQEVSHSAARADQVESEAQGGSASLEGVREAHMMSRAHVDPDAKQDSYGDSPERDFAENQPGRQHSVLSRSNLAKQNEQDLNEQRPTRPLDLDPERAQVPAENIRYMRHLGFSPPDPNDIPEDGHGWIYLNLLRNMAQLHTINVTADFVHKALTECSSKFEVSADGRKVRWKGGRSITHSGSSAGGSSMDRTNTPDGQSPRKRPKLTHRESAKSSGSLARTLHQRDQPEANKLNYTPLFFHKDSTDEADSSDDYDDSDESPFLAPAGDSLGMTSSGVRTMSSKKQKTREDGPIIFYNNARFCTDLSGDRKTVGNANAPPYTPATAVPLGVPQRKAESSRTAEKRGPLAEASELPEPMDLSDNPIPVDLELSFPAHSPRRNDLEASLRKSVQMEVTGIGGVWPADHFAIAVESRQARLDHTAASLESLSKQRIPSRLAGILQDDTSKQRSRAAVQQRIIWTKQQILPPAELPPALSFMPFGEDSLGDDYESDADEELSMSPGSLHDYPLAASPQPIKLNYAAEEEEYSEDEESDDGSLDLLAAARELDPAAIQAQEREYDANMADRLAEEIPAGSSAATAGGGSGFASPAADVSREEYRRAVREALAKCPGPNLKRSKTADSIKVEDPRHASCSEDEDDDMDDVAS